MLKGFKGISGDTTRLSAISSTKGMICNNGGTQIGSNLCMCPGGLVGKNCESHLPRQFYIYV